MKILRDPRVRAGLQAAWRDSLPSVSNGHEEGGFILRISEGNYLMIRWPEGAQSEIFVPPHTETLVAGHQVVATFHTHPNTGADYQQEPSETDCVAVREDMDLKAIWYEGEYVLSETLIYRIRPEGSVEVLGNRSVLLGDILE